MYISMLEKDGYIDIVIQDSLLQVRSVKWCNFFIDWSKSMVIILTNFVPHIIPFMEVMGQVVTIWGFLNFINQLNLQNLTLVADRALGRLPGLKHAIFVLKTCDDKDIDESLDAVNEIVKPLYMDLKQLGIAKNYDMKQRIGLLSDQNNHRDIVRRNYLQYELGSDFNFSFRSSFAMKITFLQNLENELLHIFDLSHAGQTFVNHLSTNVMGISWISLVIYLIQCNKFSWSGYIFLVGLVIFFIHYFAMKYKD